MPELIPSPTVIEAAGPGGKVIEEFVGLVNTDEGTVSVARMRSPQGWEEAAQTPEFDEFTLVLSGLVVVEHDGGRLEVRAGEAVCTRAGERIRYTTPAPGGAEYVAICLPAFSPAIVHREDAGSE